MRGFGGNGRYTVIVAMLCFGVGLDAIYLERPVWEVDVGGRKPRPLQMPLQPFGGFAESEQGDWSWNNPDLMYYQPEYQPEYLPEYNIAESKLSERTHFQEAQQASQVKQPAIEAEEQMPYLVPRPYAVPQAMEQDREDGWGKPILYQPNWQSEAAPVRPYQLPQQQQQQQQLLEQQSRPPKPVQIPPRVPGDRPQGQWAEKGPEYELKESSPSTSTADRLLQLQMLQQQQWMQEQQLKQQELAQQQNQLRQQEMLQQQLKQQQQQQLQQQQEQHLKLQQQKLKQQQLQQQQEALKQQQEAQRQLELKQQQQQEEEKQREQEVLERQKELKRQQELMQQQQEQLRQRELQRQQELQQQQQQQQLKQQELLQQEQLRQRELQRQQELQQQEQLRQQELQQQKLKQPQPYMPVQPIQPKPAPVQRPVKRPQPNYNQQPEVYAGGNDDDDDPYETVPYQKPVISVDARCPRNDDPAKPVHLPSTSCSKFMKCFNGIAYEMSCPGGLEFDKKTNRCDYAAIARCSKP